MLNPGPPATANRGDYSMRTCKTGSQAAVQRARSPLRYAEPAGQATETASGKKEQCAAERLSTRGPKSRRRGVPPKGSPSQPAEKTSQRPETAPSHPAPATGDHVTLVRDDRAGVPRTKRPALTSAAPPPERKRGNAARSHHQKRDGAPVRRGKPLKGNDPETTGPHAPSLSGPAAGHLTTVPGRVPPTP